MLLCTSSPGPAQDTGALSPPEALLLKVMKAYETESIDMLKQCLWYNSPKGSKIIERANYEFSRYDTITLNLKPLSTVFYKKFGYENVEVKVMEEFHGVDVTDNSVQDSVSMSVFTMFIDLDGTYYILNWERVGSLPVIKIQKNPHPQQNPENTGPISK